MSAAAGLDIRLKLGQPVIVERSGDPMVPVMLDKQQGRIIGFSQTKLASFYESVPTVGIRFDDERLGVEYVVRWHVFGLREDPREVRKRQVRAFLKRMIG